ncbi:uncharacterized protein TEOVI_000665900 [Trypanosoma equiperdum]|uniref:Uncharacterized protein n=3 Tax=Trypanozoon TaxID=39700 RepID=Q386R9_TRYB2|nr:hypothetical protein, conserved [Trypanosoma brucei gambiense DAL972]XP_828324.1 hypothetical protein, conserved [Trypanosoma brucei brucei TREU927]EAN79212.1 hypothetical protein, conserved [Trypanosoma brucei brucei TREU927]CBH17148.1 hypothetical protein, conserved [Trypanosoma brucei gambiense DAL972]SCU68835.1 hypothetical protein, conserved [Trypanosoma equiperdum]|eukprot:XP_011779412.1 hypothetical protein, conserved [Trypanosoma brucei gambiense DAL972]
MGCGGSKPNAVSRDVEEKALYLRGIKESIDKAEGNMLATLHALQALMRSYESTSYSFVELAHGTDGNTSLKAKTFESDMRTLKDSGIMPKLQKDLGQSVSSLGKDIRAKHDKANVVYREMTQANDAYCKLRERVNGIEKSYAKKNKPVSECPSYTKNCKERDVCLARYEGLKKVFLTLVEELRTLIRSYVTAGLTRYAFSTADYAQQLVNSLQKYKSE